MRPTPIPEAEVWDGGERVVIGPPVSQEDQLDPECRPVEVVVDFVEFGGAGVPRFNVRVQLEDDDLERLQKDPSLWVSFIAYQMPPMAVGVLPQGITREGDGLVVR